MEHHGIAQESTVAGQESTITVQESKGIIQESIVTVLEPMEQHKNVLQPNQNRL